MLSLECLQVQTKPVFCALEALYERLCQSRTRWDLAAGVSGSHRRKTTELENRKLYTTGTQKHKRRRKDHPEMKI